MPARDVAQTYPIADIAGGGAHEITVFTPDPDKIFVVLKYMIRIETNGAISASHITFRSGATDLSGPMYVLNATDIKDGTGDEVVFIGRLKGEAFKIYNADGITLQGYSVIAQESK